MVRRGLKKTVNTAKGTYHLGSAVAKGVPGRLFGSKTLKDSAMKSMKMAEEFSRRARE